MQTPIGSILADQAANAKHTQKKIAPIPSQILGQHIISEVCWGLRCRMKQGTGLRSTGRRMSKFPELQVPLVYTKILQALSSSLGSPVATAIFRKVQLQ